MKHLPVVLLLLAVPVLTPALAQPAETPAAPAETPATPAADAAATPYSVATTRIGTLLDVPACRAIFAKYLPEVANHPQVEEGRDLTLPEIVQYAPDLVTPEKLAAIDAELKALPQQ
jgi:para-nitrobenzyl esterase